MPHRRTGSHLATLGLLASVVATGCAACDKRDSTPAVSAPATPPVEAPDKMVELPRGRVTLHGENLSRTFEVEIAATEQTRHRGLMFRKSLAEGTGMIFLMPGDGAWSFYMRNTYVPLDMIFVDRARKVACVVEDARPLTEESRGCGTESSRYVVEVNAMTARTLGLKKGARVEFNEAVITVERTTPGLGAPP